MMKTSILVNNKEIEKVRILDLLNQENRNDAIRLICTEADVRYKSGRDIVQLFEGNNIDRFDGIDLFLLDFDDLIPESDGYHYKLEEKSEGLDVEKKKIFKNGCLIALALLTLSLLFFIIKGIIKK